MSIASMTGFARNSGNWEAEDGSVSWVWELKSVNGKALDVKVKLPPAWEELGIVLKSIAAKHLQRGSLNVLLEVKREQSDGCLKINSAFLEELAQRAIMLYQSYPGEIEKPVSSQLLAIKGVAETEENPLTEDEAARLREKMLAGFEDACCRLKADREKEGEKIRSVLVVILQEIKEKVRGIEKVAATLPEKIKEKLQEQLKQWLEPSAQISEDRLAQEIVFYVTRADIREETDRLKAHIKTAEQLLNSGEAVGRRLDFLCQELNREANTTCSKSTDVTITNLGMDLKALIEQFREQVQNIE